MSRFSWRNGFAVGLTLGGVFAIFCLVWVIGLNYCPDSPCNQYSSNTEEPANNENWLSHLFGSNIASDPHPADQNDHPKYYEHQDLAAQEIMAEATKWIVILTAVSLFIGAVGAGAIIWTLLESRKVSNAAIEANQIMRDEQRPWLDFEVKDWNLRHGWGSDGKINPAFTPTIRVKNWGDSPAHLVTPDVKIYISTGININEVITAHLKMRRETKAPAQSLTIYPGQEVVADKFGLGQWEPVRLDPTGEGIPSKTCWLVFFMFYKYRNEDLLECKLFSCETEDLLPRPSVGKFSPRFIHSIS